MVGPGQGRCLGKEGGGNPRGQLTKHFPRVSEVTSLTWRANSGPPPSECQDKHGYETVRGVGGAAQVIVLGGKKCFIPRM